MEISLEVLNNMTDTMQANPFGIWLRQKRRARGWSQDTLVDRAGNVCSKAYVSMLETNKYLSQDGTPMRPNVEIVDALADALGESRNEARKLANWAPTESELDRDEVTEEFTDAISRFKRLSDRGREFFTRHIDDTLDFLIEVDMTSEQTDESEHQNIRFGSMEDVPGVTVDEARRLRRSRGRKKGEEE